MTEYGDNFYFETTDADGTTTQLHLSGVWGLTTRGGFGAPPISYITQPHYQGHGEEVLDYRLEARQLALSVVRQDVGTADEFWANRETILLALRPNYATPTKFVIARSDGQVRAIDIRPDPGITFEQANVNAFAINEAVALTAHNPIWYDPTSVSPTVSQTADEDLVFPIDFPISFGAAGVTFSTGDLAYAGSWLSRPYIVIDGAYSTCTVRNTATGIEFTLINPIVAGEQRIIELDPDVGVNVTDENGNNKWSDLSEGSNLRDFIIYPDNELEATQKINAVFAGSDVNSNLTVTYYKRYYGI